eukprot:Amastigsp_a177069_19.p7 type:complete len:109 gc:universal Amastigsp_a177069_19:584-910(+)
MSLRPSARSRTLDASTRRPCSHLWPSELRSCSSRCCTVFSTKLSPAAPNARRCPSSTCFSLRSSRWARWRISRLRAPLLCSSTAALCPDRPSSGSRRRSRSGALTQHG